MKFIISYFVLIIFTVFTPKVVLSQIIDTNQTDTIIYKVEDNNNNQEINIPYYEVNVPPPPDINNFTDYSKTVSNNLYTGTINFSVPIITLQCQNYKHNISFNYSCNGIRIDRNFEQIPRWGNSWTLNAGGFISRTVHDIPDDEDPIGLLNTDYYNNIKNQTIDNNSSLQTLFADTEMDTEPDEFNFSFDNYSGTFYILKDNYTYKIISSNCENLKITPFFSYLTTGGAILKFEILTPEGNKYLFEDTENTEYINKNNGHKNYISKWYLSKIYYQNKLLVSFQYKNIEKEDYYNNKIGASYVFNHYNTGFYTFDDNTQITDLQTTITHTCLLTKITTDNVIVEFDSIYDYSIYLSTYIKILNRINNILVKEILIDYKDVFIYRLISSISFIANNEIEKQYSFNYYDTQSIINNSDIYYSRDIWGFFNNISYNFPKIKLNNCQFDDNSLLGTKTFNNNYAKIGLLNEIVFPTGGKAKIEYEPHEISNSNGFDYWKNQFDFNVSNKGAGYRVKSIVYSDINKNNVLEKSYTYKNGIMFSYPFFYDSQIYFTCEYNNSNHVCYYHAHEKIIIYTDPIIPYSTVNGSLVGYSEVTETIFSNKIKTSTLYKFTNTSDVITSTLPEIYAPAAPISPKIFALIDKSTERNFNFYLKNYKTYMNYIYDYYKKDNTFLDSIIIDETVSESFKTKIHFNPNVVYSYKIRRIKKHGIIGTGSEYEASNYPEFLTLTYINYLYPSVKVDTIKEIKYSDQNIRFQKIQFSNYEIKNDNLLNFSYLLKTSEGELYNNNKVFKKEYKYPIDFPNDSICIKMRQNFQINSIIEKNFINNSKTTAKHYWEFSKIGKQYLPTKTKNWNFINNTIEDVSVVDLYDTLGNLIQYHTKMDIPIVVLWGYNSVFPIAKIENITKRQVDSVLTDSDYRIINSPANEESLIQVIMKLRASFPQAHIFSYTYDVVYGMLSATDPAGKTTYYEYDTFGRLKNIKDQDGNIIKHYEYHFYENN